MESQPGVADAAILAPALDPLVAVLVQAAKVFPHFLFKARDRVARGYCFKSQLQVANGVGVELVLVALEVAELGELLVACVELACEWLCRCVDDLVRSHVAPLCKGLAADFAAVWSFAGVASLMGLEVSQLREALATSGFLANLDGVS